MSKIGHTNHQTPDKFLHSNETNETSTQKPLSKEITHIELPMPKFDDDEHELVVISSFDVFDEEQNKRFSDEIESLLCTEAISIEFQAIDEIFSTPRLKK